MSYVVKTSRGNYVAASATIGSQIRYGNRAPSISGQLQDAMVFGSASDALTFVNRLVNQRPVGDGITKNPLMIIPVTEAGLRETGPAI